MRRKNSPHIFFFLCNNYNEWNMLYFRFIYFVKNQLRFLKSTKYCAEFKKTAQYLLTRREKCLILYPVILLTEVVKPQGV